MKRKVLLYTSAMAGDFIIILTDAPKEEIEKWLEQYLFEQEEGQNTYFDSLKTNWEVNVLADSENGFSRDDIDCIGYDEVYDAEDYSAKKNFEIPLKTYEDIYRKVKEAYDEEGVELGSMFFDFQVSADVNTLISVYRNLQKSINGDMVCHFDRLVIKETDNHRYVYGLVEDRSSSEADEQQMHYTSREDFLGLYSYFTGNMKDFLESYNGKEYETGWCRIGMDDIQLEGNFISGYLLDFVW